MIYFTLNGTLYKVIYQICETYNTTSCGCDIWLISTSNEDDMIFFKDLSLHIQEELLQLINNDYTI